MQTMKEFLRECNLIFTKTLTIYDFARRDINIDEVEINYEDCINLFELIYSFNNLYLSFKNEYDKLEKLNVGEEIFLNHFSKFNIGKENYRVLSFDVDKPTITNHPNTVLHFREVNNKLDAFVSDGMSSRDKYYHEKVEISETLIKSYLDLFERYELLFKSFDDLKNRQIMGDQIFSLYTVIDEYEADILKGLKEFKVMFGNDKKYVNITMNLGENFGINTEKSNICEEQKEEKEYKELLNNTYVNKIYERSKYFY